MHRDRESEDSHVTPVELDEARLIATAEELLGQARQSVDVCFAELVTCSWVRAVDELLQALVAARGDAIRVRVLLARSVPRWGRFGDHLYRPGASEGFGVRMARVPLADALVVDGRSALLIADSPIGPQASVTCGSGVSGALSALFTAVWDGAAPVPGLIDWGDRVRSELVSRILGCLHAGMSDELGARELSVSMRTYQRHVAEITTALGTNSRFQAGFRAAELGLLPVAGAEGAVPHAYGAAEPVDGRMAGPAGSNGSFL